MRSRIHWLMTAMIAAAVLAVPSTVHAQIRSLIPNTGQPISAMYGFLQNANLVGQARFLASPNRFYGLPPNSALQSMSMYGGFGGGYGGYGYGMYPYYGDFSLGNTLQGAASVINAQGQFNIQNQQAKLLQQQADQAKLD